MTVILTNPRERTRFLRFAVVGLIGFFIDAGVMNLLVRVFYVPFVLAGTISFIAAVLSNFTWNRHWTYPDSRSKPLLRQLGEFTIVNVIGLLIRVPTLAILGPITFALVSNLPFEIPVFDANFFSDNLALVIAVINLSLPTLAIPQSITVALIDRINNLPFEIPVLDAKTISQNLTLVIAVIIVLFWNFFVNRYLTYSDVE